MKNCQKIFISWLVFPAISLKYSHEMKKPLHSFISWQRGWDSSILLCPFTPLFQTSITYVRSFVFP